MTQTDAMARLLNIMAALRTPETGCPWDLAQNFSSIVPHTLEEAYEVADAIEQGDMNEIRDELGDLLFQVVFYARLAEEQQAFDFDDIATAISDKLVRRHPHVFADQNITDETELQQQWQRIKATERQGQGKATDNSILANIPAGLEPLMRADKIQRRCASVGFDWTEITPVADKVTEELQEVLAELEGPSIDQAGLEEEVGDLLFAVVNLARHVGVDSNRALRRANTKFTTRFRAVEQCANDGKQNLNTLSLAEMEALWQQVKRTEKNNLS